MATTVTAKTRGSKERLSVRERERMLWNGLLPPLASLIGTQAMVGTIVEQYKYQLLQ